MADTRETYLSMLKSTEKDFHDALLDGTSSAERVAIRRGTFELMDKQFKNGRVVDIWNRAPPHPEKGYTGAALWYFDAREEVSRQLFPHTETKVGRRLYRQRQDDYMAAHRTILEWPHRPPTRREDEERGIKTGLVYLISPNREAMRKAAPIIADEFVRWFERHPMDLYFLSLTPEKAWPLFLVERPAINTILRLIDNLPRDVTTFVDENLVPPSPGLIETVFETAISLIPVVGTMVALYEAFSGRDLFGYSLSNLERGVLSCAALIPFAGVVSKGGKVAYTETRLAMLSGRKAVEWERALSVVSRLDGPTLLALERAEIHIASRLRLTGTIAKDASTAINAVARPVKYLPPAIPGELVTAFRDLTSRYPIFATLDELAIARVLAKGPNVNHIKGQLLEELVESRLVPWLLDRSGMPALGIKDPRGRQLVFFPGHQIRDVESRQITDGILGWWDGDVLEIAVIFEAKAGKHGARELSFASRSISSLSGPERAELRSWARDVHRARTNLAKREGRAYKQTIEDVEREMINSELGGQVQHDFERLYKAESGKLAHIRIGDSTRTVPVRVSPTRTRLVGVVPRDAGRATIERQLMESGFNFEIIGVDLSTDQMKRVAERLQPLHGTVVDIP